MKIKIVLFLLVVICSVFYFYQNENSEPDYSETQWRTFYGKKPVNYRPEFWVTYYTDTDNCREFGTFSLLDGSAVPKKIYKEFLAEDKENGTSYVIRYPDKFKIGKCMYYSGGGRLYIEEKSNDPRLKTEEYASKTQVARRSIIYGGEISSVSLVSDSLVDSYSDSVMYLNNLKYNVFCYKIDDDNTKFQLGYSEYHGLRCYSASIENGVKKYMKFDSYSRTFWKEHPNIEFNVKISRDVFCTTNIDYCEKNKLISYEKALISAEKFQEFYKEQSYE